MAKLKKKLLKLLLKLVIAVVAFIAVTFTVYICNLDMKLTAAMEPILFKFYDRVKRDQHL